jgi:phosphocarrier protein HPr
MKEEKVIVKWRAGLHARRAVDLVNVANKFRSSISVKKEDIEADAKSIINLMTLEASYKTALMIIAVGEDEDLAISAILELFNSIEE